MASDNSRNDARIAYLRRFNKGWEGFHTDRDTLDDDEAGYTSKLTKREPRNLREYRLKNFLDRWQNHHRAEEEGDAMAAAVVIKLLGPTLIYAGCTVAAWLLLAASRRTQWVAVGVLSLIFAIIAHRILGQSEADLKDE